MHSVSGESRYTTGNYRYLVNAKRVFCTEQYSTQRVDVQLRIKIKTVSGESFFRKYHEMRKKSPKEACRKGPRRKYPVRKDSLDKGSKAGNSYMDVHRR